MAMIWYGNERIIAREGRHFLEVRQSLLDHFAGRAWHHFRVGDFSEEVSALVNAYCDEIEARLGVVVAFKPNRLAFARLHCRVVPGGRPRGSPVRLRLCRRAT